MADFADLDQHSVTISPDEDPHAHDDPIWLTDSEVASSTRSFHDSILNYQYENGRRYHRYREGEYYLPNDEQEQTRLDLHHHLNKLALRGALFCAPIDPSEAKILDLGTGTGIWAIEMAEEYPNATIIGTDLSPIQPFCLPPNCSFQVDDFESEWEFMEPFDFIFARNVAGSVRDFPALFKQAKKNLKNGGWVEFTDFIPWPFCDDDTIARAPNNIQWNLDLIEASQKFGKNLNAAPNYAQWMRDAGFKNVREEVFKVPYNPWAKDPRLKEMGRYHQVNMMESAESYTLALFTRVLGFDNREILERLEEVKMEMVDRSIHLYTKFLFVYGQKDE